MSFRRVLVALILFSTVVIYNALGNDSVNAQVSDNQFYNKESVKEIDGDDIC